MAITKIRVVSITSKDAEAGSNFFCNFYVKVGGEIIGAQEIQLPSPSPGGATQHDLSLKLQKDASEFSDNSFSFDIDAGGDVNDKWLPSAIYVFGLDGDEWKLLSAVMEWPAVWVGAGGNTSEYKFSQLNS